MTNTVHHWEEFCSKLKQKKCIMFFHFYYPMPSRVFTTWQVHIYWDTFGRRSFLHPKVVYHRIWSDTDYIESNHVDII
jgi:hypothetical protein